MTARKEKTKVTKYKVTYTGIGQVAVWDSKKNIYPLTNGKSIIIDRKVEGNSLTCEQVE